MSKKVKKATDLIVQNSMTKVFLLEKKLINSEQNELEIVSVQLPRKTSMFIKSQDEEIHELMQFNEKHRSFFLDNSCCSNGKVYVTTKIDPLFIFIQYLEERCKTRAQPLEQILEGSAEIFKVLKLEQMKLVADQKGPDDLKAFKYNEDKTVRWLKKKFEAIVKSLKEQNIISSGASSLNYVKSSADSENVDEDALNETALGIISEYISLDLIDKLDQVYGIGEKSKEPIVQKRKSEANDKESDRKRMKIEEQENLLDQSPTNAAKTQPKVTTKSKAFEKAAKGTKSISSFFSKK